MERILLLFGVSITRISEPKTFFGKRENKSKLEETVETVRKAFGRMDMDYEDIYLHLVSSEILFLLSEGKRAGRVLGMAAYDNCLLLGIPSLIVEGIAIDPLIQAKNVFREVTDLVSQGKNIICLRTQNPHMYRALQNYCSYIYPGGLKDLPPVIKAVRNDLASKLQCKIDENGILKGHYGGLFYGQKPYYEELSEFFEEQLGMNLDEGDALLVVGIR